MFNQTLHRDGKHIFCYGLQTFSSEQTLERHVNNCQKINGKQMIKIIKKDETVKFKNST